MSAQAFDFTLYVGAPSAFRKNPFLQLTRLCHEYCEGSFSIRKVDMRDDIKVSVRATLQEVPSVFLTMSGGPARRLGTMKATEAFLREYTAVTL